MNSVTQDINTGSESPTNISDTLVSECRQQPVATHQTFRTDERPVCVSAGTWSDGVPSSTSQPSYCGIDGLYDSQKSRSRSSDNVQFVNSDFEEKLLLNQRNFFYPADLLDYNETQNLSDNEEPFNIAKLNEEISSFQMFRESSLGSKSTAGKATHKSIRNSKLISDEKYLSV